MARITLELPAGLLRRVKTRAAEQGRSMNSLVAEALETALRRDPQPTTGWRAVFGRARPGATREVARHLAELRRVDPEDWD